MISQMLLSVVITELLPSLFHSKTYIHLFCLMSDITCRTTVTIVCWSFHILDVKAAVCLQKLPECLLVPSERPVPPYWLCWVGVSSVGRCWW